MSVLQVLLLWLACSSPVLSECCTGLLEPAPLTPLRVTYTCRFTQKHKKLALGRSGIICALPKSCVIINSLGLCLSPEAWCLVPLQKRVFIPFCAFKYSQSLSNHC